MLVCLLRTKNASGIEIGMRQPEFEMGMCKEKTMENMIFVKMQTNKGQFKHARV